MKFVLTYVLIALIARWCDRRWDYESWPSSRIGTGCWQDRPVCIATGNGDRCRYEKWYFAFWSCAMTTDLTDILTFYMVLLRLLVTVADTLKSEMFSTANCRWPILEWDVNEMCQDVIMSKRKTFWRFHVARRCRILKLIPIFFCTAWIRYVITGGAAMWSDTALATRCGERNKTAMVQSGSEMRNITAW